MSRSRTWSWALGICLSYGFASACSDPSASTEGPNETADSGSCGADCRTSDASIPPPDAGLVDAARSDSGGAVSPSPADASSLDAGRRTAGCGRAPADAKGGVNVTIDAGIAGDGQRRFFLSLPKKYDPSVPHRLILGYPGTNWKGEQIQPYLQLEGPAVTHADDEIFVYPDPLWRNFSGWGNLGGWLLGPNAAPANGDQDLVFTRAIVDYMKTNYCIDEDRVFATGHSWGGDMAMVVACFLGDLVRASVPVAANRPYWFETSSGSFVSCQGHVAVWEMFGRGDDHFSAQKYPGEFGDQGRDFWLKEHRCTGVAAATNLGIGAPEECVEYAGCASPTRYCLYDAKYAHQIPDAYYAAETLKFFRSF